MWGIIPAAGAGSRIQPLAFSKELLPIGSRIDGNGEERPCAVSEYLVERMLAAGATRLCFVISPGKSDIMEYYGAQIGPAAVSFVVQPRPAGLCDAIFRALPFIRPDEQALIGLPDTIWFPHDGFRSLPDEDISLLLFPVEQPELFDAVVTDRDDRVMEIQVKRPEPSSSWIWGAIKCSGSSLAALHELWCTREQTDEYMGHLLNAYINRGGTVRAYRTGVGYVDVGTLHGFRAATALVGARQHGRVPRSPSRRLPQVGVTEARAAPRPPAGSSAGNGSDRASTWSSA